jgi:hypothetical protein
METLTSLVSALSEAEPITLVVIVSVVALCVVYLSIKQVCKAVGKKEK